MFLFFAVNNFMINENGERKGTTNNEDKIQADLSGDSFLQTSEEYQKDKKEVHEDTISVSRTADRETDADQYAGSDRAGTAERKSQTLDTEEAD
jgi:hypothetical protein